MPLPDSPSRKPHHTRQLECLGFERDDGLWEIEAHLLDTKPYRFPNHEKNGVEPGEPVHKMSLRLTLDLDFLIHKVDVAMDDTPFKICRQVENNMLKLEGIRIGPGWLREVRTRIPKTDGCTHVLDLLGPIATTAYQSMHLALEARANGQQTRNEPPILDQCHSLARHTEVVKIKWPEYYTGPDQSD